MKKALVVGIDNYPYAPLSSCVNDATSMAERLKRHEDGSKNFDVRLERNVFTKAVLKSMIIELFSGDHDVVLLYFSGHGSVNNFGGYIETPDGREFDEGIQMDDILKLAHISSARHKIIILDCCYSGIMGTPMLMGKGASYLSDGVTILTASKYDQQAVIVKGKNHSMFTSLLLEALQGGAANINGDITPAGIYSFIDQILGPFDQRPVFKTNTTSFISLRNALPRIPAEILKKITAYFSVPDKQHSLSPAYEYTNVPTYTHVLKEPYAEPEKIIIFQDLQKMHGEGLVEPAGEQFMYDEAMNSGACRLTPLGQFYWRLVKDGRI